MLFYKINIQIMKLYRQMYANKKEFGCMRRIRVFFSSSNIYLTPHKDVFLNFKDDYIQALSTSPQWNKMSWTLTIEMKVYVSQVNMSRYDC